MWVTYKKTFSFRDCFNTEQVEGSIKAINDLLTMKQANGVIGVGISTELIYADIATSFYAFQNEETGEWILEFSNKRNEIASVFMEQYKEINLEFTIEENLEDGKLYIHSCLIKGFKEYQ